MSSRFLRAAHAPAGAARLDPISPLRWMLVSAGVIAALLAAPRTTQACDGRFFSPPLDDGQLRLQVTGSSAGFSVPEDAWTQVTCFALVNTGTDSVTLAEVLFDARDVAEPLVPGVWDVAATSTQSLDGAGILCDQSGGAEVILGLAETLVAGQVSEGCCIEFIALPPGDCEDLPTDKSLIQAQSSYQTSAGASGGFDLPMPGQAGPPITSACGLVGLECLAVLGLARVAGRRRRRSAAAARRRRAPASSALALAAVGLLAGGRAQAVQVDLSVDPATSVGAFIDLYGAGPTVPLSVSGTLQAELTLGTAPNGLIATSVQVSLPPGGAGLSVQPAAFPVAWINPGNGDSANLTVSLDTPLVAEPAMTSAVTTNTVGVVEANKAILDGIVPITITSGDVSLASTFTGASWSNCPAGCVVTGNSVQCGDSTDFDTFPSTATSLNTPPSEVVTSPRKFASGVDVVLTVSITSYYPLFAQMCAFAYAEPVGQLVLSGTIPACSDSLDNDGDGLVDFGQDPECAHPNDSAEAPRCSDGFDNDTDGLIDFDGGASAGLPPGEQTDPDPQCASANGDKEHKNCGLGAELLAGLALLAAVRRRS
ncbi:MAG: hypothetical protein ACQGVK_15180 [Myxococcota bacterium]